MRVSVSGLGQCPVEPSLPTIESQSHAVGFRRLPSASGVGLVSSMEDAPTQIFSCQRATSTFRSSPLISPSHNGLERTDRTTETPTAFPCRGLLLPRRHPPISPYPSAEDDHVTPEYTPSTSGVKHNSRQPVTHARRAPISAGAMSKGRPQTQNVGTPEGIAASSEGPRTQW